jgi:acetyl-CoA/propionyl-CoA carboxylase biotin carboxyl carrier protein
MAVFRRVLVANRGEIAVRVMRTLRRLGIESVAVYTDADRGALHTRMADWSVDIGGARAYLDIDAVIGAAADMGAEAIHPGYGFLSENPAFARACMEAGVVFVGPPAEAIEAMGDKINAKRTVAASGVAVVPGRDEAGLSDEQLVAAALEVGLPVLLKPSAGGGGKGMRLVEREADLAEAIASSRREATNAFGDGTLLVERFVVRPRHVEMQVFADRRGTTVALGERECTLQRRHQKIIEEAPSPLIDAATRQRMAEQAVAAAKACGYVGAGTVEFIVSADRPDEFFFMEMNTRLQVEHPVTEMVLDLDLVELQLRVAAGEPLPWAGQDEVPAPAGHAMEARVYAEDPERDFLPSSGVVVGLHQPDDVRVDSALEIGLEVGTRYDPMLAKVIAHGDHREEALDRLRTALGDTAVLGLSANVGFLRRLLDDPDVRRGEMDTGLVERRLGALSGGAPDRLLAEAAALHRRLSRAGKGPWDEGDGWRAARPPAPTRWRSGDTDLQASGSNRGRLQDGVLTDETEGIRYYVASEPGGVVWLSAGGDAWRLEPVVPTLGGSSHHIAAGGRVTSPMPGTVLGVHVQVDDLVEEGARLVTVEAMKMEHAVTAPARAKVVEVLVHPGSAVKLDQPLVVLAEEESG